MTYLLDSCLCIDVLRNVPTVIGRVSTVSPDECVVSAITVFELLSGVRLCRDPEREGRKVAALLAMVHQAPFDAAAAAQAALVRGQLERLGTPLGPYDTLLAGHALALGVTLVTANVTEFQRVTGLRWENWRECPYR
jgi:tRNA(fMet)-specific endonuclease VapC